MRVDQPQISGNSMMMRCGAKAILLAVAVATAALTQAAASENKPSVAVDSSNSIKADAPSALASDLSRERDAQNQGVSTAAVRPTSMSELAVGDHWTYELKDEIGGKVVSTRKVIVTDISDNQVATRVDAVNTDESSIVIYDKAWNVFREGAHRYSPNDGTGIRSPLMLNAEWRATVTLDEVYTENERAWIINVYSRVTGQETIATKAGTFQAYVVETTQAIRSTKD